MKSVPLAVVLLLAATGCRGSKATTSDVTTDASSASASAPMLVAPPADAAAVVVADEGGADARASNPAVDGTIGLLVERVMIDPGQVSPSFYGYDLLVIVTPPGKKAIRRQPFCPPLKRDMYAVCRRFRSCTIADAGMSVTCDGTSFELVQQGGTYLRGEAKEIEVSKDTPVIAPPSTRSRSAYVDL